MSFPFSVEYKEEVEGKIMVKKFRGKLTDKNRIKRHRTSESRFEHTPHWKALKADIEAGLKPQEYTAVEFSSEDSEKYGITSRRTLARFVRKYLTENKYPYRVVSFKSPDAEGDIIQVANTPVVRNTA